MKFKRIIDLHVHTDNSFDGNHSAMFLCEQAVERGLRAVAFTDHIEVDAYYEENYDKRQVQSFFEVAKARSAFFGKLLVCEGIELGQAVYDFPTADKIVSKLNYDFILGSVHNLKNTPDFCFLEYEKYSEAEIFALLDSYFDEIIKLTEWGKFDSLAHLTYPLRYIVGEHGIPLDISRFHDKIDVVFKNLISKEKALEINTSTLRQKLGLTMPDKDLIRRFKQLGGEYITIGSDAHFVEHLGAGIEAGMQLALDCGFDSVTIFQKREKIQIPIE